MQFTTCALIVSPLGYLWLENLEAWFPGTKPIPENKDKTSSAGEGKSVSKSSLNVTNTIAKVVIDQVVGGAWTTALFIVTMGMLRGLDMSTIKTQLYMVSSVQFIRFCVDMTEIKGQ